jgi:hypothetical protein
LTLGGLGFIAIQSESVVAIYAAFPMVRK